MNSGGCVNKRPCPGIFFLQRMTAGTNDKHEENSNSISGNRTTNNSEHETGSVTIPGDDCGATEHSNEMNLPVQTHIL